MTQLPALPRPGAAARSARLLPGCLLLAVALLAAGLAAPRPAEAHPHVWIDADSALVFEDGKLVGLRHDWTFDPLFSLGLIEDFASDPEAGFTAEEIAALRENAFSNLRNHGYFTLVRADGQPVEIAEVTAFDARIVEGERVAYSFELRLAEPLDPRQTPVDLGVYDESYYVDVALEDGPLDFVGGRPEGCMTSRWNDEANRIYFELVAPLRVSILCQTT